MTIPKVLLKRLYTEGSLKNTDAGAQFALKNRLSDVEVVGLGTVAIDGRPAAIRHPLPFPLGSTVTVETDGVELPRGRHEIEIAFETRPFGTVKFKVQDAIGGEHDCGSIRTWPKATAGISLARRRCRWASPAHCGSMANTRKAIF
jgi:hydroxymethylglutaryl-CoA reductase (NADPH)